MDNDFATGYALGSDSNGGNCNNGGFWGGDGWWAIIIFAMIFGWGLQQRREVLYCCGPGNP